MEVAQAHAVSQRIDRLNDMAYDIIGDIHGHSEKLTSLLHKLGYRHHLSAWRHPDRSAIFVGDFIDRGPGQLDTIDIVRGMLDAGTAQAVMGNHEFNAIAWHTPNPESDGEYLRRRGTKNRNQHNAFLAAVEHDPELHKEHIDWFLTLPLWLDLPELRVIHACWHPGQMAAIAPLLKPGHRLDRELVVAASRRGSMEHRAVETLINGIEIDLPAGHEFHDKGGHRRRVSHHRVRTRWWDAAADTYRKAAILDEPARTALPNTPIPSSALLGYDGDKPVFFGHYWWTGIPEPLATNVACVDYSAGLDGPLVAYRWDGEPVLDSRGFVSG